MKLSRDLVVAKILIEITINLFTSWDEARVCRQVLQILVEWSPESREKEGITILLIWSAIVAVMFLKPGRLRPQTPQRAARDLT